MPMKFDDNTTVSAAELGQLIGVTARAVRGLAERKVIARATRGRYALVASVRACLEHYREVAAGRGGEQGVLDLAQERARLARLQGDGQELKNATTRGEAIVKADVIDTWKALLRGIRQMALAWPGKAAFEIPTLSPADRGVLVRIVRDDLEDAALGRGFDLGEQGDEVAAGRREDNP
jgi:terminase small subunit / prophage DNA-packing protein